MRKMEIKKVGVVSTFKVTIYLMIIPMILMFLIGVLMAIVGAIARETGLLVGGIIYGLIPVFLLFLYGAISMLVALIYNWLSGKFGGLEIYVKEEDENL